jgi:superfamily I DNA/RNA helicase
MPAQKQAVDAIDGPVLVIAGPGTGKTQLLSARVANILPQTDTPAKNVLCLTFTESGAQNMRERLTRFIGQTAYEVNIGTYHAFGGDLIRRYPEYFAATRLQNPADELAKRQILNDITGEDELQQPTQADPAPHLGDLITTISEIKRALLTPEDLRAIAREILVFITNMRKPLQEIFADFDGCRGSSTKSAVYFEQVKTEIQPAYTGITRFWNFRDIGGRSPRQSIGDGCRKLERQKRRRRLPTGRTAGLLRMMTTISFYPASWRTTVSAPWRRCSNNTSQPWRNRGSMTSTT